MALRKGFQSFLDILEKDFKCFINYFRSFNFSNLGSFAAFLILAGICNLIIILIWTYVISFFRANSFSPGEIASLRGYIDFLKYSNLARGTGIITIGLFALMIRNYDAKEPITFNMLFGGINIEVWKNFGFCVLVYLLFTIFVPESALYDGYFSYEFNLMASYDYSPRDSAWWLNNFISIVYSLLPYFLASLMVQLGGYKFTFNLKSKVASVFAGMTLLLIVVFSLNLLTDRVTFYITSLISVVTGYEPVLSLFGSLLVLFINTFLIGAKARSLGADIHNKDEARETVEADSSEILDDL